MVVSMDRWVGKVAIVTGASAGIGAATAEQLVIAGLKVVGLARRVEKMEEAAKKLSGKKGKFYPLNCDLRNEEDILNAFKWTKENLGPVSILINNAGLIGNTNLIEGDTEVWKKILDVNVLGLSIATREAVRDMRANNIAGHVIHINSIAGHRVLNVPNCNMYPASKHAVTALTETLRLEFNRFGLKIKITSVSPGLVETEFASGAEWENDARREIRKTAPILKSEDIADAIIYALSTPPHVQVHELIIKPVNEAF